MICAGIWSGCTTTEQEVADQIEILAANEIESERWNQAVEELVVIGRPAARQLLALLPPTKYIGKEYREFRTEIEKARTGAVVVLGRIKHKAASVAIHPLTAAATYTYAERVSSLRTIGELGFNQATVTALKALLIDPKPSIRLYTALALAKMGEHLATDQVKAALMGSDEELARIAVRELRQTNHFGVPLLVALIDLETPYRADLEQALSTVGARLLEQLASDDPEIRMLSAQALGDIGDTGVAPALEVLLDDASNLVRFNAASSLSRLGVQVGTNFLFASMGSDDPILRGNAVRSLVGVQRSAKSADVEKRLISTLGDDNPLSRSGAAQVLGQAGVAVALPQLLEAIDDRVSEVRYNAVIALGRLGSPGVRARLTALIDDADDTVAYYAEWALKQLGES